MTKKFTLTITQDEDTTEVHYSAKAENMSAFEVLGYLESALLEQKIRCKNLIFDNVIKTKENIKNE